MQLRRLQESKDKVVVNPDDVDVNGVMYPSYLLDKSCGAYNLKLARNAYNNGISDLVKCQYCIDSNVECVFMAGKAMRRCALCRSFGRSTAECDRAIFKPGKRPAEGLLNGKGKKLKLDPAETHVSSKGLFSWNQSNDSTPIDDRSGATPSTSKLQTSASQRSLKKSQQLLVGIELGTRIGNVQTEIDEKMKTMNDQAQNNLSHVQRDIDDLKHQIEKISKAMSKVQKKLSKLTALVNSVIEKSDSSS